MSVPSPAPGVSLQGISWPCLPDSTASSMEVSGSPQTEEKILSLPQGRSHLASECARRWTVCLTGLIQGRSRSFDGAFM